MKNLIKNGLMLVAAGVLFTACEKSETEPAVSSTASATQKTIDITQVANYLYQEGIISTADNGNGVTFVMPPQPGTGFFIAKDLVFDPTLPGIVSGQIGGFEADFGAGDYWRENPDGTTSVKISSNNASASYFDFGTGDEYLGSGSMHMIYTAKDTTVQVPFPPFELTFLIAGARASINWQGTGKVTLDGQPGPEYNLRAKNSTSASQGGQSTVTLEFD